MIIGLSFPQSDTFREGHRKFIKKPNNLKNRGSLFTPFGAGVAVSRGFALTEVLVTTASL